MRADYEQGPIDIEVAWRGGTNNPIAAPLGTDFSIAPGTDRSFPQWKAAYAPPNQPFEVGAFGTVGTYITTLMPTQIDRYNNVAPYFQIDPIKGFPGLMGFYASGHDSNPGIAGFQTIAPQGPNYTDAAIELMQPIFKGQAVLNARDEVVSNGLGTATHYYYLGTSFRPVKALPGLFGRFDIPMAGASSVGQGRPTFQWALQYEFAVQGPMTNPYNRVATTTVTTSTTTATGGAPASIYAAKCSACHGANGQGTPGAFPALAGDKIVNGSDIKALVNIVALGKGTMPAYRSQLSDADLAALLTYIRSNWGNTAGPVTVTDVAGAK